MTPLLLCAYKPRYLSVVLEWLKAGGVQERYMVFVWDNGGAASICAKYGVRCSGMHDDRTHAGVNVGKAMGMRHLVDIVAQELPSGDVYVCMDDDVIVDRQHLDALVAVARRPGIGMVGARFHPFNSPVPPGGTVTGLDPCPACAVRRPTRTRSRCRHCAGSGKDPSGLHLRIYPAEDRTLRRFGRVAGTLFAISKDAVRKLNWAPYLYPVLAGESDKRPIVYWGEDGALDGALTTLGLTNGYLESPRLTPAIHLPELNEEYMKWKIAARLHPPAGEFDVR